MEQQPYMPGRAQEEADEREGSDDAMQTQLRWVWGCAPNGSRLSCGRNARGRKEVEAHTKRLDGERTQFFLTGERPPASSAC